MANSHRAISWLRRRTLWLLTASLLLLLLPLGGGPVAAETAPAPTPMPPIPPGTISFEVSCAPDIFRPDVWVAAECTSRLANSGSLDIRDVEVSIGPPSGVIPDYYLTSYSLDDALMKISTGALSFGRGPLRAGQTVVSRTVVLLRMRQGRYESDLRVTADGGEIASVPLAFMASRDAAMPPSDLEMTTNLESSSDQSVTYATAIRNVGKSTVTELTLRLRYEEVELSASEPPPVVQITGPVAVLWHLGSFGKKTLEPGEEVVLRTTYVIPEGETCGYASQGVVAETTLNGERQLYGERSPEGGLLGVCGGGDSHGAGTVPLAFGRGGEGPGDGLFDVVWAATFLAAGGAALVGLAALVRRRVRR